MYRACQEKVKQKTEEFTRSSTVPPATCRQRWRWTVPSFTTSTTTKFRNPQVVLVVVEPPGTRGGITGPPKTLPQETFLEGMAATLGMIVSYDFRFWWISSSSGLTLISFHHDCRAFTPENRIYQKKERQTSPNWHLKKGLS